MVVRAGCLILDIGSVFLTNECHGNIISKSALFFEPMNFIDTLYEKAALCFNQSLVIYMFWPKITYKVQYVCHRAISAHTFQLSSPAA